LRALSGAIAVDASGDSAVVAAGLTIGREDKSILAFIAVGGSTAQFAISNGADRSTDTAGNLVTVIASSACGDGVAIGAVSNITVGQAGG
jgi:hypothetical protein